MVHLHQTCDWLDYPSFFRSIPREKPIVWTLHDAEPLTAGCHYPCDCERYRSCCRDCPQLLGKGPDDARREFASRRNHYPVDRIHVVADSRWLCERARKSSLLGHAASLRTIYYGLDTESYTPRDRAEARQRFGLGAGGFCIGFCATDPANRRKGFRELSEAFGVLRGAFPDATLLVMGEQRRDAEPVPGFLPCGTLREDCDKALFYSACDVFVIPSLDEAFGRTAMEAMACGTPCVGFRVGGIPEVVDDGYNGVLVPRGDARALGSALVRLGHGVPAGWPESARRKVLASFAPDRQAREYLDLYQAIWSRGRGRG